MKVIAQDLTSILESLSALKVEWQDETARRVIEKLEAVPQRKVYTVADVTSLLDPNFDDGILICRLFLGLSKDEFMACLRDAIGDGGCGVQRYRKDTDTFLQALLRLGVLEAMAEHSNRTPRWTDTLVERLRSGRGSAISGQRRGRSVEDFAEEIIKQVFGTSYECRCTFVGPKGTAKCDFAIPSRSAPGILVEAKGYGATGSKMTDIIGDIEKIIAAKRADTALLFFTDGLTWRQRKSDLRRIVQYQNEGDITRIYTYSMAAQFEADLRQLKTEYGL